MPSVLYVMAIHTYYCTYILPHNLHIKLRIYSYIHIRTVPVAPVAQRYLVTL